MFLWGTANLNANGAMGPMEEVDEIPSEIMCAIGVEVSSNKVKL